MASKREMAELSIKICAGCKRLLHFASFPKRETGFCGFDSRCAECIKNRARAYRSSHQERERELKRRRTAANRDRYRAADLAWRKANPEKIAAIRRRTEEKRASDPNYKLHNRMRCGIRDSLLNRRKSRKTFDILDFSLNELRAHLERQFLPGMSWENMGGWHIDHIVPKASFNIKEEGDAEFMKCWALTNLRPIWAKENLRKHAKVQFLC